MSDVLNEFEYYDTMETFEFERRFFCNEFPEEYNDGSIPHLIIQNYFLASDGYAIRVRVQSSSIDITMHPHTDPDEVLRNYQEKFDLAFITVKGPSIGGTRFESEKQLDVNVATQLVLKGENKIIKNRHSAWIGNDGWVIDEFGGVNHDLVIAECERMGPVTDLIIPAFALFEVTDDKRFSNDQLVNNPFSAWKDELDISSRMKNNQYRLDFGMNKVLA